MKLHLKRILKWLNNIIWKDQIILLIINYQVEKVIYNLILVADFLISIEILSLIQAQYTFENKPKIKSWLMRMLKLDGILKG